MPKDPRFRSRGPGPRSFLVASFALALAASTASAAAWTTAGIPFCNATGDQSGLRAVTDGHRGFIAAWIDPRTSPAAIYCQRVDSTGTPRWAANGELAASGMTNARELVAVADGQDGVLLAWTADLVTGSKVYVQRLDSFGSPLWGTNALAADTTSADSAQSAPTLVSDGSGGAIVAWVDGRGTYDDVYAQRVQGGGTFAWTTGGVRLESDNADHAAPRLLGDGAGGAWASWENLGTNTQTYFQRLDGAGAAQWTAGGISPNSNVSVQAAMGRMPGRDTLMVAWQDSNQGRIEGTLLFPNGSFSIANGSNLQSTTGAPVAIVTQAAGTSFLVFATTTQIQALPVSGAGVAAGSAVTLATGQTLDATSNVTVVGDGGEGLYATWSSGSVARARHLTSSGTADWVAPVTMTSGVVPAESAPASVGGTDLLVAWVDGRDAGTTGDDLYTQRVAPNGVTGTYYRLYATVGGGSGAFSQGGGRSWVREGDSLRVKFAGTSGQKADHLVVGGTTFNWVPNYTFHGVTADSTLQAFFTNTAANVQLAAPAGSYRAFSVPGTFSNDTPASVFANLMPYDPARWRLGHWSAGDSAYIEPGGLLTHLVPGAGYWFIGLKDTTLSFSVTPSAETPFDLAMAGGPVSNQGWTQFGSPFRFPVAVSQLRVTPGPDVPITDPGNSATDQQVLEWNPGSASYGAVSVLQPGRVYWLWRQSASAISLRFPYEWNPVATGGLVPRLATGADWQVDVTARSGDREARLAFGAAPVAAGRWNRLSTHAPPDGPGEGLSLVARVSDWGADNGTYRAVFRPDAAEMTWDFDASAPAGLSQATISFAFADLPAGRHVVLSEPASGWSREVAAGEDVPLVLSATPRRLRLAVVTGSAPVPATPAAAALRAAGPNPFHDATTLSFSLAHGGPLRWEVFDLAGRRVAGDTRTLTAGEHAVTWDGRDGAGRSVQPGLYLLRWRADGRTGTARLVRTE